MHHKWTANALQLHYNCTTNAIQMHKKSIINALRMYYKSALHLNYNWTTNPRQMHYKCTTKALEMHYKIIMLSKHYHFHALQVYYKCTTYQVCYPESTQSADKKSADISANPQIFQQIRRFWANSQRFWTSKSLQRALLLKDGDFLQTTPRLDRNIWLIFSQKLCTILYTFKTRCQL